VRNFVVVSKSQIESSSNKLHSENVPDMCHDDGGFLKSKIDSEQFRPST
jgi:hypothetical protein